MGRTISVAVSVLGIGVLAYFAWVYIASGKRPASRAGLLLLPTRAEGSAGGAFEGSPPLYVAMFGEMESLRERYGRSGDWRPARMPAPRFFARVAILGARHRCERVRVETRRGGVGEIRFDGELIEFPEGTNLLFLLDSERREFRGVPESWISDRDLFEDRGFASFSQMLESEGIEPTLIRELFESLAPAADPGPSAGTEGENTESEE